MNAPAQAAAPQRLAALNPVRAVQARFRAWWQARLPLTDTVTLTQRNVYILPTRPGLMLAATLLVLLVASINYQLNLGYLLTFLLAGSAVLGLMPSGRPDLLRSWLTDPDVIDVEVAPPSLDDLFQDFYEEPFDAPVPVH